ncbi:MAG: aspartate 1-decarboxylase [Pseudomonadota bacterium]
MVLTLLKAKLHKAEVTHSELEYEGSCAIDAKLLKAANIIPYEKIDIYNLTNGERFSTYAIEAEQGSRIVSVNGAAAHKAQPGHQLIIAAYTQLTASEALNFKPTLVYLEARNEIKRVVHSIPVQAA